MELSDVIGFAGVSILLLAYVLDLFKITANYKWLYLLLNFIGAAMACTASIMIHYTPFIILEGTWAVVSIGGLINSFRK